VQGTVESTATPSTIGSSSQKRAASSTATKSTGPVSKVKRTASSTATKSTGPVSSLNQTASSSATNAAQPGPSGVQPGKKKKPCTTVKVDPFESHMLDVVNQPNDEDTLYCNSLVESFKRLDPRKKSLAKIKVQQLLHEIEFNDNDDDRRAYSQPSSFAPHAQSSMSNLPQYPMMQQVAPNPVISTGSYMNGNYQPPVAASSVTSINAPMVGTYEYEGDHVQLLNMDHHAL
jgi:hypothetical protein